jgi:hypothetical protein
LAGEKSWPHCYLLFLGGMMILAGLACATLAPDEFSEGPAAAPEMTANVRLTWIALEAETTEGEEHLALPVATPLPPQHTATPPLTAPPLTAPPLTAPPPTLTPAALQPIVVDLGFGQDRQDVGFAFVVENPDGDYAWERTRYEIEVYDGEGALLKSHAGYISYLLPGQRLPVAGRLGLPQESRVSTMDVQLSTGRASAGAGAVPFEAGNLSYFPGSDYLMSRVTGTITNPYDRDLTDLWISAVLYDEVGAIVGGGFTFLNFLLAHDTAGVSALVIDNGRVAGLEMAAMVTGLTELRPAVEPAPDDGEVTLLQAGFGQDGRRLAWAMLVDNGSSAYAAAANLYHVTIVAEDGRVAGVDEGYLNLLLPGHTLGVAGELYLPEGIVAGRVEARLKSGNFDLPEAQPSFAAEKLSYRPGLFQAAVTATIVSRHGRSVTMLRVDAVCFDEEGQIIGGGYTYLDLLPANGKAAVEVPVTTRGTPAAVAVYATVSVLSEFGE